MADETHEIEAEEPAPGFPRWKKVVLTCAAFVLVAGIGLKAVESLRGSDVTDQHNVAPAARRGAGNLVDSGSPGGPSIFGEKRPGGVEGGRTGEAEGGEGRFGEFSPMLLKGGLSFFVAFCVGYAVRTFLKISAVVLGLVFLAVFGLSYFGLVEVDWDAISGHFDRLVGSVGKQASSFKEFMSSSLPSAGMAGAGFFTGVKKN